MTSNTLRYNKAAISNNSRAIITVERACTTAKHKKYTVQTWFVQFQTKKFEEFLRTYKDNYSF